MFPYVQGFDEAAMRALLQQYPPDLMSQLRLTSYNAIQVRRGRFDTWRFVECCRVKARGAPCLGANAAPLQQGMGNRSDWVAYELKAVLFRYSDKATVTSHQTPRSSAFGCFY